MEELSYKEFMRQQLKNVKHVTHIFNSDSAFYSLQMITNDILRRIKIEFDLPDNDCGTCLLCKNITHNKTEFKKYNLNGKNKEKSIFIEKYKKYMLDDLKAFEDNYPDSTSE